MFTSCVFMCGVRWQPLQWVNHSFRGVLLGMCVCVRSRNLKNKAVNAQVALLSHRNKNERVHSHPPSQATEISVQDLECLNLNITNMISDFYFK